MKGDFNKECNRTACDNKNADFYNHSTRKFYCPSCARKINEANYFDSIKMFGHELCIRLSEDIVEEYIMEYPKSKHLVE